MSLRSRESKKRPFHRLMPNCISRSAITRPKTPNANNHDRTAYSLDQNPRDMRAKSRAGRKLACLAAH